VLISRGNHKSAIKYTEELYKTEKEVAQGRVVPLPLDYISSLKNGELAPVGMDDKQWTKLTDGSRRIKLRLTYGQSFNTSQGKSSQ
jgi:ABC-type Fe3+-citrate transport system substrate-binding protein